MAKSTSDNKGEPRPTLASFSTESSPTSRHKKDAKTEEEILQEWEYGSAISHLLSTSIIETEDLVMPKKETLSAEVMKSIVSLISDAYGITDSLALQAIYYLFLKKQINPH